MQWFYIVKKQNVCDFNLLAMVQGKVCMIVLNKLLAY